MKYILIILSITLSFLQNSYAQEWTWARAIRGANSNIGIIESTIDNDNNIYTFGFFTSEIILITDETQVVASAGDDDLFLAKFDPDGNPLWMRFIQSAGKDVPKAITFDDNNNIYILGDFKSSDCSFPSPANTVTLTNTGLFDVFVAKYTSDGDLVWAQNAAWGTKGSVSGAITIDPSLNRIIYSGWFATDCNFGPIGSATATINATSGTGKGVFIASMDLDGNYIDNEHLSFPNTTGAGNIVSIKYFNNSYYMAGKFTDQVQLGTSLLTASASGDQDAFLYKTDLNFNEIWSRSIHGTSLDYISSSVVTPDGYFAGGYTNSTNLTFESSTPVSTPIVGANSDIFILKYDFNGEYVNSHVFEGDGTNQINFTTYHGNNILFAGGFSGDINIGSETLSSTAPATTDVLYIFTDNNADPIYADQVYGTADDQSVTAYVDNNFNLFIAGTYYSDPLTFDSDYGNDTTLGITTSSFSDAFIAKHKLCNDFDIRFVTDLTSCPSSNDGSVTAYVFSDTSATADTVRYSFEWLWNTLETSQTISNLGVGQYTLTATSEKGCVYVDSVILDNDPLLVSSLTDRVTLNCFYDTLPSATVLASLGQRPYVYQWSASVGSFVDSIAYDLLVGTHVVTVTDACGTQVLDTIVVDHIPTLTSTISTHNTIIACPGGMDGEAWMNTQNGYSTITYQWENSTSTDYIASDLAIGLHHITVTDGCISIVDSVNVVNLPVMYASISENTDVTCSGNADGSASVFVVGGVQPYSIAWSSGELDTTIAYLLQEGMQYVTVTDACGTKIDSVEIGVTPSMDVQLFSSYETCNSSNGEAVVVVTNGSGMYSYVWDTLPSAGAPISTNDTVSNLPANTYYITVTDACGSVTDSIVIGENALLVAGFTNHIGSLLCDTSSNGSATVVANGGVMPYVFTWSSSSSTGSIAHDLSVGTEYVTVTDQCGTQIVDSILFNYFPKLIAFAEHMSDASCIGSADGQASLIATGGVQPYTFAWSNSASTSNIASDLPVGTQYVTVSDVCGSTIDSVEINHLPVLTYSFTNTSEQCSGDSLGFIDVVVANGVAPVHYNWGTSSMLDTNYVDSLWSGMHYVTITDACNMLMIDSVEIISTAILQATLQDHSITLLCASGSNGQTQVDVNGGLMPYTYAWSNGNNAMNVNDLSVGMHFVSVVDMCQDTVVDSVYVSNLPTLMVEAVYTEPLCYNDSNGTISITITQGIEPYTFSWNNFSHSDLYIDSLPIGIYKYSVMDQCGTYIDSVILSQPDSIIISGVVTNESKTDAYDGSISIMMEGGTVPYSFNWGTNGLTQDLMSINSGVYNLTVIDYNNCSATASYTLEANKEIITPMDVFTPNADGVNDYWTIENIDKFPDCTIKIFNEWGNLVFESIGYAEVWDGTSNGKELPAAVYYYVIDLKDGNNAQSGSITLLK
ncbi:MAG: gliding motility-associated C-terminal domain-containing protein [Bacteroidales bacterium]|nr:gliding motility-associated C-terminal domain-containing protein [Bacteroidales bacterium]